MALFDYIKPALSVLYGCVLVTCIGVGELSCGNLEDAQPYGYEHLFLVIGADGFVHVPDYLGRRLSGLGLVLDHDL